MDLPRRAVFPVLRFHRTSPPEEQLRSRNADFLGTGFFVERGEEIVFVTARHVVDIEVGDGAVGVGDLVDNTKHAWGGFDYHPTADLAIAAFRRAMAPTFAVPLRLHDRRLELGDEVESYGFPFSGEKRRVDGHDKVRIEELFFRGHVHTEWSADDLEGLVRRPFSRSYAVSFSCPAGLSGSPLLIDDGSGRAAVGGVVYGNRTIDFPVRSSEEISESGVITRVHEVVDRHRFGLAADLADLLSMID